MSYVHTSGRFNSSYSGLDQSPRFSSMTGSTLQNSPVQTDYGFANDSSPKGEKTESLLKKSPLRDTESWDGHVDFSDAADTPALIKKMKYGRLRYIDGLRLLAALLAMTSTVIGTTSRTWSVGSSILHPFNSNFGLVLFLAISGRTLGLPWLLNRRDAVKTIANAAAKAQATKQVAAMSEKLTDEKSGKISPTRTKDVPSILKKSLPSSPAPINAPDFELVGMSMLARPFRFLLPVLFVTGIQYGVCEATNLYPNSQNFANLIGVRPGWCFTDGSQWIVAATNLFVLEDQPARLQSETGSLFFLPWLFQNSYYLYGLTMIVTILQRDTRVSFMIVLAFLSWCTLSYISPAILGLLVAELDVSGHFGRVRRSSKLVRYGAQSATALLFLLFLLVPQVREPVDSGLSTLQVLRPATADGANIYSVIRFTDVICALLLLVFLEISEVSQKVLSLAPISMMGQQLSAAIVAIHGIVLWAIMPKIFPMTSADSVTSGAATNLAGIWALTLVITLALSIVFRVIVEIPSEILGRAMLIAFYGQENMQRHSTMSTQHVQKAKNSGYLLPLPSLGNPMAKLGLTKVPWTA